jgi:hypothetical protein
MTGYRYHILTMDGYPPLLNKGAQIPEGLLVFFFQEANLQFLQGQRPLIMLLRSVEQEQGLLVLSHPKGSTIFGLRDNFDIKIPMGLEGLFIRDK